MMMKIATSLSPRDRIWATSLGKYFGCEEVRKEVRKEIRKELRKEVRKREAQFDNEVCDLPKSKRVRLSFVGRVGV